MNSFDYEVMQKKRIAAGARHRKCGSKSKFCALPSDNMTTSEWKRRNGKVKTYSMNLPMTWGEFKSMPLDLQQSYIDSLQSRFNISINRISVDLFGLCQDALRRHVERKGLKHISMPGYNRIMPEWYQWINGEVDEEKCEEESEIHSEKCEGIEDFGVTGDPGEPGVPLLREHDIFEEYKLPEEAVKYDIPTVDFGISNLTTTFKGEFDPVKFMNWISALPIPSKNVTITLDVEVM